MPDPILSLIAGAAKEVSPWVLVLVLIAIIYTFVKQNDTSAKTAIIAQNQVLTSMLEVLKGLKVCMDNHDLRVQSMQNTLDGVDRNVTQLFTLQIERLKDDATRGRA